MAHYIFTVHVHESYATYSVQDFQGLGKSASDATGQIHLRCVSSDYHLGVHAHSCQEHLYLCRSGVLSLIKDNNGIVQRASSHESQGSDLHDVLFHHLAQLLCRNHILQSIVEGLQIRVYLVPHVTRQETKFLTCLHRRARKDYLAYLLVLQRAHGQCYAHVCLAATGRSGGEYHIVLLIKAHQFLLVLASGGNRFARYAVHHHAFHALLADTFATQNMQDILLSQAVVLQAVFLEFLYILLQSAHFQFIAHHMEHVATCHNAQLGIEGLHHLDIGIIDPIEHYRVHIFQYDMLFYHLLNGFVYKVT